MKTPNDVPAAVAVIDQQIADELLAAGVDVFHRQCAAAAADIAKNGWAIGMPGLVITGRYEDGRAVEETREAV